MDSTFLPLLAMFAVIVVFMVLPNIKRAKQEKQFFKDLKRGDRVIMRSGMHGKVVELSDKDSSCVIETSAGKIKFERNAISVEGSKKLNASTSK